MELKDIIYFEDIGNEEIRWEISPKSISNFFKKSDCILRIPPYQRPYSWGKEQMLTLFKDIERHLEKDGTPCFLGPLFTTRIHGHHKYVDILDGQQRITSITIILREAYVLFNSFEPPISLEGFASEKERLEKLQRRLLKCLITDIDDDECALFETDESVRADFKEYIESSVRIQTKSDYDYHIFRSTQGENEYEQTYKNLVNNINVARKHLLKLSEIDESNPRFSSEGFNNFCDTIEFLLTKCWIIEIPLKDEDYILEIFESINNRGKRLTLTDLLRFKTIHLAPSSRRGEIKNKWSKLYMYLDRIEGKGYITDTDHFFEIFINAYSAAENGKALSKDDERIKLIEDFLLAEDSTPEDQINVFFERIFSIVFFFEDYVLNRSFIENYAVATPNPSYQEKIKAEQLMKLVRMCFKTSKNSLLLGFYLSMKHNVRDPQSSIYFLQPFLNLVKYTVLNDINLDFSSNIMRNLFVETIHKLESNEYSDMNFYHKQDKKFSDVGVQYSLVVNNNSNYHKLVILLVQFLHNYDSLKSVDSYALLSQNNLEHFYPKKWETNWGKMADTSIELAIENVQFDDLRSSFSSNKKELFLKGDGEEKSTIIQSIGNKLLIHGVENRHLKNKSFHVKIAKLSEPNVYVFPLFDDIRFNELTTFSCNEIVEFSNRVVKVLEEKTEIPYAEL